MLVQKTKCTFLHPHTWPITSKWSLNVTALMVQYILKWLTWYVGYPNKFTRLSNHMISSLVVWQTRIWSFIPATCIWKRQCRRRENFENKLLRKAVASPCIEKDAYRANPIQLLSRNKFVGRPIVTECPRPWWVNHSWILFGGKQELYKVDGWKSCKIELVSN